MKTTSTIKLSLLHTSGVSTSAIAIASARTFTLEHKRLQQKSLLLILCGMELCDWLIDFQGIPRAGALTIRITVLRINSCTAE